MTLNRWPAFAPAILAIVYGAWLIFITPPTGFADLAGVIVVTIGVLASVFAAAYLIADVYWWRAKAKWWRDLLAGMFCIVLALGGIALLARF